MDPSFLDSCNVLCESSAGCLVCRWACGTHHMPGVGTERLGSGMSLCEAGIAAPPAVWEGHT